MIRISHTVVIDAPIEAVFDAERNISLHADTQAHRGERAVAGVTTGLINLGEEVEWEASHFGIRQRLRVRITQMNRPVHFRDEMVKGIFTKFIHDHSFETTGHEQTTKTDVLEITAPLGPLGYIAERMFLGGYMKRFIRGKNLTLKKMIENSEFGEQCNRP
jgi:ligand-binding SRPBCC domain-containing protein